MHRIMHTIMNKPAPNITGMSFRARSVRETFSVVQIYVAAIAMAIICVFWVNTGLAAELTENQRSVASVLTEDMPWPQARSVSERHPLGAQTLSIEKQERKNHHRVRWVNVYQYNYPQQTARLLVVDLDHNEIIKQSAINTAHLPLNQTEIDYAIQLLTNNAELVARLNTEYAHRHSMPFTRVSELDIKASIYEPRSTEHSCHLNRCALLSLFDHSRTVFTIEPVVNLSTLSVSILNSK